MKKKLFILMPLLALTGAGLLHLGGCAATPTARSTGEFVDDASITAKVKTALVQDAVVSAFDVGVDTYKGTVQLNGFVDTAEQRSRAGEVARGVAGVTDVQNRLAVKSQATGLDPNRGLNPAGPTTGPVPTPSPVPPGR